MRIRKPDGRVRRVKFGNVNSASLRERIATAMMGGSAAFELGWAIAIYTGTGGSALTGQLHTGNVGPPSRSGTVVTLASGRATVSSTAAIAPRPGTIRSASISRGVTVMSSVDGLSEAISNGDQITLSWQWTFSGLVASANTNAALLAAGGSSGWDWSNTRAQYSIQSGASVWRHRGEPSRNGASIEYATPNAVLSNSSNLTVYWWRVVRSEQGSTEVVSRQALNRVVQAGARATGTWDINVV